MDNQMSPVVYNDGILANVGTMNKLRSYKRAKILKSFKCLCNYITNIITFSLINIVNISCRLLYANE